MNLPTEKQARKEMPIASGVLAYFPNAIAEVAHVSFVGNQQHNPGQPLHWSRHKSNDHKDCVARHLMEVGTVDTDGLRHTAKLAWRALALLQIELENATLPGTSAHGDPVPPAVNPRTESMVEAGTGFKQAGWTHEIRDESGDLVGLINTSAGHPGTEGTNGYSGYAANPSDSEAATGDIHINDQTLEITPYPPVSLAGYAETHPLTNDHIDLHKHDHLYEQVEDQADSDRHDLVALELVKLGCPPATAKQIVGGISFSYVGGGSGWAYISGPMRGIKNFNFPAFDAARDALLAKGYHVISPADIDRNAGDGWKEGQTQGDPTPFVLRDFWSLFFLRKRGNNNAIALLPNWERSVGAAAELFLARWLGLSWLDKEGMPYPGSPTQHFAMKND